MGEESRSGRDKVVFGMDSTLRHVVHELRSYNVKGPVIHVLRRPTIKNLNRRTIECLSSPVSFQS